MQDLNLQWVSPRVSKTRAYTNSANPPKQASPPGSRTLLLSYQLCNLLGWWLLSSPIYIKLYYKQIGCRGWIRTNASQSQSLLSYRLTTRQYGGADGSRTRVQKIFTNHKSHSYLTGFVYTVLSLLFTIYKSQEQVLMLKLSTQEPIRINLFARQSLLVNTIMLSLIAY